MKDTATRRLEMFIRARQFGAAHKTAFPADTRGGEVLAQLNTVITDLEGHASKQASGQRAAKEGTTLKSGARAALREDLEAISRTARALALTTPGLDDKFRLPRNAGEQAWLAAARSFAQDAAPLKSEFLRRGLPADFLEDLNASIAALEASINNRAQQTGTRVAATVAIDAAIDAGMNAVRELHAIVHNIFRDDPATLAEWTSASHTERAPRHAKPGPSSTQPTPPQG
ncbi:MAG TPA: hypothetical protein VF525_08350 [Pyrinomonadaceae bacterium]|jgi:hypothetical protein